MMRDDETTAISGRATDEDASSSDDHLDDQTPSSDDENSATAPSTAQDDQDDAFDPEHAQHADVEQDERDKYALEPEDDELEQNNEDYSPDADEPDRPPMKAPDLRRPEEIPLAEELGIEDLFNPIFGGRGRLFSAAGPRSPVAEFTDQFLIMYPPQKPFAESGPSEDFVNRVDNRGVLLDELGKPKYVISAKYKGNTLWYSGEQMPGTLKQYAIWFDPEGNVHMLYVNGEALTTDIVYKLRNKTHDGELSTFADVESD
jgi:hypothetical protein